MHPILKKGNYVFLHTDSREFSLIVGLHFGSVFGKLKMYIFTCTYLPANCHPFFGSTDQFARRKCILWISSSGTGTGPKRNLTFAPSRDVSWFFLHIRLLHQKCRFLPCLTSSSHIWAKDKPNELNLATAVCSDLGEVFGAVWRQPLVKNLHIWLLQIPEEFFKFLIDTLYSYKKWQDPNI